MLPALWLCLLPWAVPPAAQVPLEVVWRARQAIEIPIGDEPQSEVVSLPAVSRRDGVLCLRFAARLTTKEHGGWNQYLGIEINGTPIDGLTPAGEWRLLNWPRFVRSTYPNETRVSLFRERSGLPCLLVFFAPDSSSVDPRIRDNREQGCWFIVDVSDLLREDRPNTLKFTNTAIRAYWPDGPDKDLKMVVEGLEVGYLSQSEARRLRRSAWKERTPTQGITVGSERATLTLPDGGGLQIAAAGQAYFLESSFTCLQQEHQLLCKPQAEGWAPNVRQTPDGSLRVQAACEEFSLSRTVRLHGHRVEVSDSLTNLTDEVIGVLVRHELILPEGPSAFRLGGKGESSLPPRQSTENPTLFATQAQSGLGLVAEDNILRLQMGTEVTGNRLGLYVENVGLAPGASYTFKFALYPGGTDYFEFVNAVRRDWNVNFTVLGPFDFVSARDYQQPGDADKLRALLSRKKLRLFALSPWFEYYNGYGLSRDDYKALMQRAIGLIKSVEPEALCIALVETNLYPVPFDFFRGTLPQDLPFGRPGGKYPVGSPPGVYGWPAPPEATAIVDDSPWADSCVHDDQGRALLDTWYSYYYVAPPGVNLLVYPRLGNQRHRVGLDQMRFLFDEVGFDGVYFDQFSLAWGGSRDSFTYEYWDGNTVEIDPDSGEIIRQYADLGLVGAEARRDWVRYALSRGKVVVANSMPAVMETQSLPTFRFMETQGYDPLGEGVPNQPNCAKGQLASPIGLGHAWWAGSGKLGAEFFVRTVCAHLRYGLLYYYYATDFSAEDGEFGPLNHMFPFTPVALHEGWIEGKERTITCVSGTFLWRGASRPAVHLFDSHGREKEADVAVERKDDAYQVQMRLSDWHEVAVIE